MAFTWVVCIDGTWNQPGQTDKDPVTAQEDARPSNVAKTWQALADTPLATDFYYGAIAPLKTKVALTGLKGEVLYLNGIGTTGTVTRFLEGATGTSYGAQGRGPLFKRYRHHGNRHKVSRRRNRHRDVGTNSRCLSFSCRALPR